MKRLLYLAWLSAAALGGCQQDPDLIDCNNETATLRRFTTLYATAAQPFSVAPADSGRTRTFTTQAGATVQVPSGAFVLPTGGAPTGAVELRVREVYTPGEMVLAQLTTVAADGRLLHSGGAVRVTAWQGATPLRLRPGAQLRLQTPAPAAAPTLPASLWTLTADTATRWQRDTDVTTRPGPPYLAYNFNIRADSMGWHHVARPWPTDTSATRTTVRVTAGLLAGATRVYLVAHARNAVLPVLPPTTVDGALEWRQLNLPVGTDLTAVVLQLRDNQFYYGTQRAAIGTNHRFTVALEPLAPVEIARRIRRL